VILLATRGANLLLLEQLHHSTTIFEAFITQWALRRPTARFLTVATCLMAIWSLSPLGGQAVLRVLSPGTFLNGTITPMYYFNTSSVGGKSYLPLDNYSPEISAVFFSSLIAPQPIQDSTIDSWSNVKIPVLESITSAPDLDGWYTVPDEGIDYSSLVGAPITGIPTIGSTNFTMISSYFYLVCSQPTCLPLTQEVLWSATNDSFCSTNSSELLGSNRLGANNEQLSTCSIGTTTPTSTVNSTSLDLTSNITRQIIFQSELNNQCIVQTTCDVHYSTVENNITCKDKACKVTSQRPYTEFPYNVSPLDSCSTARQFYISFAGACGPFRSVIFPQPSSLEVYLMTGLSPLSVGADGNSMHNMSYLTDSQMSQRLTRLVNTFYLSSMAPDFLAGGMDTFNFSNPVSLNSHPGQEFLADVFTNDNVYVCNHIWFVILIVATLVKLAAAGLGVWLDYVNIAPDIFGYVSTGLTRGSKDFRSSAWSGSTLDGFDRTKMMGDVMVKLGDVQPRKNTGLVVFASPEHTDVETLKRGRTYL
jgi:hypothetical protein